MSAITQGVLMAITVTVNKYASSNVQAVHRSTQGPAAGRAKKPKHFSERRGLLLSTVIAAATQVSDSKTELLNKYLKKTEENKIKNDKERLDSYYKRNYKDYFEFVEGSLNGKTELLESEKGIIEWLKKNK